MNWVDLLILVVWATAAFLGYRIGVFGMVCSLVAVVVASVLAKPVGELFSFLPANDAVAATIGFAVVFTLEIAAIRVVAAVWAPLTGWIPLVGFANKLVGGIVGFVVGFMLLLVVASGIDRLPAGEFRASLDNAIANSRLSPLVVNDYNLFDKLIDLTCAPRPAPSRDNLETTDLVTAPVAPPEG